VPALQFGPRSPIGSELVETLRCRKRLVGIVTALTALVVLTATPPAIVSAQSSSPQIVPAQLRIRAFGDSVTAGFGVNSSGAMVPLSDASACRPQWIGDGSATTAGTRCSSNGANGPGSAPDEVMFTADFGLTTGGSWAGQVARELGTVDFANYAVSGSSLVGWLNLPADADAPAEGAQHELLERIERDDPDVVLASLGGEAILQQSGPIRRCSNFRDPATQAQPFADCVKRLLNEQLVKQRLMAIGFDVLAHTQNAKLVYLTYLPAAPRVSSLLPWQHRVVAEAVNAQILDAVAGIRESGAAWAERIEVVQTAVSTECVTAVVRVPSILGSNWLIVSDRCGKLFTPVSMGTVPTPEGQQLMATAAVRLLRERGWV